MDRISNHRLYSRLAEIYALQHAYEAATTVEKWVDRWMYYDELQPEEKEIYALYCNIDRQALEDVEMAVNGSLHFRIVKKEQNPTAAELKKLIEEAKALVEQDQRS